MCGCGRESEENRTRDELFQIDRQLTRISWFEAYWNERRRLTCSGACLISSLSIPNLYFPMRSAGRVPHRFGISNIFGSVADIVYQRNIGETRGEKKKRGTFR